MRLNGVIAADLVFAHTVFPIDPHTGKRGRATTPGAVPVVDDYEAASAALARWRAA